MSRSPVLVVPLIAVALAPSAAAASVGTYQVRVCSRDAANRAFQAHADSGLTAYARCPGVDYDGRGSGLVARSIRNGNRGRVPFGSAAWQSFAAPPGTELESMSFRVSGGWASGCWSMGVFGWRGDADAAARHVWGYGADCRRQGGGLTYYVGPYSVDLRGLDRVRAGVRCEARAGCPTARALSWANLVDVGVTVRDPAPPTISPGDGAAWGDGWHRGTEEAGAAFADASGIREIRGEVDGTGFARHDLADASWPEAARCDYTRPRPCADVPSAPLALDTTRLRDGTHTLRVAALDAAGNQAAVERRIRVDNHAPLAPRGVTVAGGDAWRPQNGFDVRWSNPPEQVAPIVAARYRLCRERECHEGSREGRDIERISDLEVPGAGDWTLTVWLADEAGNVDPALVSEPIHLRLDDVAPTSPGFDSPIATDPRRLALVAGDDHSGLAAVEIELRRAGTEDWRALTAAAEPGGRNSTRIPDLELADGEYEARAVLRDAAGNETVVDREVTGRPMTLTLPLRGRTRLAIDAARPTRCEIVRARVRGRRVRRRTCRPAATVALAPLRVAFGRTAVLTATLRTADGRPLGEAPVEVLERLRGGGEWRRVGAARADANGTLAVPLAAGASRTVRLVYGGDDVLLPAAGERRVLVPAAATLAVTRRRVRHRARVVFSGRLLGAPLPEGGRTVDLQAHYRGAWRTFATPRVDRRGRWRQRYRFGRGVGRVAYRFRVLVKREAAYPYEAGTSRPLGITVGG